MMISVDMTTPDFKNNSLDLVRLLAAFQVAMFHCFHYIPNIASESIFFKLILLFPGVPIFFFISGYLISKSYESKPNLREFGKNRALRIYPALIVCVVINVFAIALTGYFQAEQVQTHEVLLLVAAKSSFVQFYNPDFMRAFGDGVLNGSLWTICVELQFYLITPIVYILMRKWNLLSTQNLLLLALLFLLANRALVYTAPEFGGSTIWKLARVSFIPWFYMFVIGIVFQREYNRIHSLLTRVPALPIVGAYMVFAFYGSQNGLALGNYVSPVIFAALAVVIFRVSYSLQPFTRRVLRGNDISYGLYIWHMPVINHLLYTSETTHYWSSYLALAISFFLALLSWKLIEKPTLKLKKFQIYSH